MSFEKLPNHVILKIFKNLPAVDLPRIRLVCRNWAEIVSDSVALRRKNGLLIRGMLDDQHEFVQTFMQSPYNIFSNIRLYNVEVDYTETVSKLWSEIGVCVERFNVILIHQFGNAGTQSKLNKNNFIKLLKHTPNLSELIISSSNDEFFAPDEDTSEFNLAKLQKVKLRCNNPSLNEYIFKILMKSAKRVVEIDFDGNTNSDYEALYYLIESQRHSLKVLRFGNHYHNTNDIIEKKHFEKNLSIQQMSLEVLDIQSEFVVDSDLMEVLANQKNLREIRCCINDGEIVRQFSSYLPKLEKLEFKIRSNPENGVVSFPANLNNLKSLTLETNEYTEFTNIPSETSSKSSKLEVLQITCDYHDTLEISSIVLENFITNCSNLRVFKLSNHSCDCKIISAIADKLVHLEHLELTLLTTDPDLDRDAFRNISKLTKLRYLAIKGYIHICDDSFFIEHLRLPALTTLKMSRLNYRTPSNRIKDVTDRGISALIDNCSLLEELYLGNFDAVTNACLHGIGQRLPHLRKLFIFGIHVTDEKLKEVHNIIKNGS